jgi:hypothetical protein
VKLICMSSMCNVEMTKDLLLRHEAECDYRSVPCPVTNCEKVIRFPTIEKHIRSEHGEFHVWNGPIDIYSNRCQ